MDSTIAVSSGTADGTTRAARKGPPTSSPTPSQSSVARARVFRARQQSRSLWDDRPAIRRVTSTGARSNARARGTVARVLSAY